MITVHWTLPTAGDSRSNVGNVVQPREREGMGYYRQLAAAAESFRLAGLLLPTGLYCDDPWIVASALAGGTERLKFLIAIRSDPMHPLLLTHMASTFQSISRGRLSLQLVAGGNPREQAMFGDGVAHDERYSRLRDLLTAVRDLWDSAGPKNSRSSYFDYQDAELSRRPCHPFPAVYVGGASNAAVDCMANLADVYLMFGEPPEAVGRMVDKIKKVSERPRFGVRMHVVARPTRREAEAVVDGYLSSMTEEQIDQARQRQSRTDSVGQLRMSRLSSDALGLWAAESIWAGYGLVRGGSGTGIVGSFEDVAAAMLRYHQQGISEFILSGYPHLEELYWFGEGVLPLLEQEGLVQRAAGCIA